MPELKVRPRTTSRYISTNKRRRDHSRDNKQGRPMALPQQGAMTPTTIIARIDNRGRKEPVTNGGEADT
jgi:hypothetical protein